jgi:hypothetical protein
MVDNQNTIGFIGFSMEWFDKRQEVQTKQLNVDELEGILCNIVSNKLPFNLWTQRHWFAIKKVWCH